MKAQYVFEKFVENSDPVWDMGIGLAQKIKKWLNQINSGLHKYFKPNDRSGFDDFDVMNYVTINLDGTLNVDNCSIQFFLFDNFPEFIEFNKINGDFSITNSKNFKSLHGFPKEVTGDLVFIKNGIRPSEEKLRNICKVGGKVTIHDWDYEQKKESRKRYKELGPIEQRKTHLTGKKSWGDKTFSRGYKIWKILEFIEEAGLEGRRYTDIIKFAYEMSSGRGKFDKNLNRGYYSGAFAYGLINGKTRKNSAGNYILDTSGQNYLDQYRPYFDDGIKY